MKKNGALISSQLAGFVSVSFHIVLWELFKEVANEFLKSPALLGIPQSVLS